MLYLLIIFFVAMLINQAESHSLYPYT